MIGTDIIVFGVSYLEDLTNTASFWKDFMLLKA